MKKTEIEFVLPVAIFCIFFIVLVVYASVTAPPKANESANAEIEALANEDDYEWLQESTKNEQEKGITVKPRIIEREPTEQERKAYREADNTWDSNNILQYIKTFEAYIKKYPSSPLCDDALILIGSSYDRLSECNKALEKFKKVKELYPKSDSVPQSLYEIAFMYFYRFDDYDNAKLYYTQFIEEATEKEMHSVYFKIANNMLEKWIEEVAKKEELKREITAPSSTHSYKTTDDKRDEFASIIKSALNAPGLPIMCEDAYFNYKGELIIVVNSEWYSISEGDKKDMIYVLEKSLKDKKGKLGVEGFGQFFSTAGRPLESFYAY